jgi:U4/U6.U5 tri-snRNP-associated protein 3
MAEPPSKRRRPDSKQMWDASDRNARAPIPSRERDEPPAPRDRNRRDDRGHDRRDDRDRDRRYRSRSPKGSRPRGDRDRGGRGDRRDDRGGGRLDRRDDRRGMYSTTQFCYRPKIDDNQDGGRDSRDVKDKPRARERSRDRDRERRRSRSPRRDREREREESKKVHEKELPTASIENGQEKPSKLLKPEFIEEFTKSRTATPPVSFRVGGTPQPHDHDRMEVDEVVPVKVKGGVKKKEKKVVEEPIEEDDDIVIEDDGMAAMQAMMGFGGFSTTQNKQVVGNDISAVRKEKKTEYRQYMNRVGGFNRPLSPSHE